MIQLRRSFFDWLRWRFAVRSCQQQKIARCRHGAIFDHPYSSMVLKLLKNFEYQLSCGRERRSRNPDMHQPQSAQIYRTAASGHQVADHRAMKRVERMETCPGIFRPQVQLAKLAASPMLHSWYVCPDVPEDAPEDHAADQCAPKHERAAIKALDDHYFHLSRCHASGQCNSPSFPRNCRSLGVTAMDHSSCTSKVIAKKHKHAPRAAKTPRVAVA